jgi:hypothetical protein
MGRNGDRSSRCPRVLSDSDYDSLGRGSLVAPEDLELIAVVLCRRGVLAAARNLEELGGPRGQRTRKISRVLVDKLRMIEEVCLNVYARDGGFA